MLWTPQKGRHTIITNSQIVGTLATGTALVSNATTLLDGAVTEVISAASNTQDSWGITVMITGTGLSAAATESCVDLLIGGATDDVLAAALICGYTTRTNGWRQYFFPVHIPQGKRIAATIASVRTSITAYIVVYLHGGGIPPFRVGSKIDTLGTQANNARGQAVTFSTSGGAATATELVASTSYNYFAMIPGYQPSTDTTISTAFQKSIGIGVGAATEDRIGTWWFDASTNEACTGPNPMWPAFVDVPSGSRITALCSNSAATNETAEDVLVYAVR